MALFPKDEQTYLINVRYASDVDLELGRILQAAAFMNKSERPEQMEIEGYIPAPVYLAQARTILLHNNLRDKVMDILKQE